MKDAPVSADQLSVIVGVSVVTIRELTRRGILTKDGRVYPLAASVKSYCDHLRNLAQGRGADKEIQSSAAARAGLMKAQAELAATRTAALAKRLISIDEVRTVWTGIVRVTRTAFLAAPDRCAARMPHWTREDAQILADEIRVILAELANTNPFPAGVDSDGGDPTDIYAPAEEGAEPMDRGERPAA